MTVALSAAQPASTDLALIMDSDSPIAETEAADRSVRAALAGIGRDAAVISFQLTARGAHRVPGEGLKLPLVHFESTARRRKRSDRPPRSRTTRARTIILAT